MSARNQGLTVALEGDRLVISIGIDALMTASRGADDWPEDELEITDPDAFAASIVRGLEQEEEDGTTPVHLAIDTAVMWAVENGEPGVGEIGSGDEVDE